MGGLEGLIKWLISSQHNRITFYGWLSKTMPSSVNLGNAPSADGKARQLIVKVIHVKIVETECDLAKDPAVYAVFDSTGDWDAIIMARFKSRAELNDYVKRALDHPNVDKTYTQVVLNITKDEKRVPL